MEACLAAQLPAGLYATQGTLDGSYGVWQPSCCWSTLYVLWCLQLWWVGQTGWMHWGPRRNALRCSMPAGRALHGLPVDWCWADS